MAAETRGNSSGGKRRRSGGVGRAEGREDEGERKIYLLVGI